MDKILLQNFLKAVNATVKEGILIIKDGTGSVSHVDLSNAFMISAVCQFDLPDGEYGVDFRKALTAVNASKTKQIDVSVKDGFVLQFGKIKTKQALLATATLPKVRDYPEVPFPCIVEVVSVEFIELCDTIQKISEAEKNDHIALKVDYDGKELEISTEENVDSIESAFEITSVEKGKGEKFRAFYSFDYIKEILPVLKAYDCPSLILKFGSDMPLQIEVSKEVKYLIAQRIDKET